MLTLLAYIFKLNRITRSQSASSYLGKETMAKFSKKQRNEEIIGSYEKLAKFERDEDIERIFNRLRPKYPIRKYVDILKRSYY